MGRQIEEVVHRRILALRSIESLLTSAKYKVVESKLDIERVKTYINQFAVSQLSDYIDSFFEAEELTMRNLRRRARQLGVPYYARLNKQQLIGAVYDHQRPENPVSGMSLDEQGQT